MVLYVIGLGLGDEKDITVRGLEAVKTCERLYLEFYTSILGIDNARLEAFYGIPVVMADRTMCESEAEQIYEDAKTKNIGFLVVGDPLCATTHTDLIIRARNLQIPVEVIHNTSVMGAAASCGLQLYQYGYTVSIPLFEGEWRPASFYDRIKYNSEGGMHTLCLLDIKVKEPDYTNHKGGKLKYLPPRFMTVNQAISQMLEVEEKNGGGICAKDVMAVGMARLGQPTQKIVYGSLQDLLTVDFGPPLHAMALVGEVHPLEQELLEYFRVTETDMNTYKNPDETDGNESDDPPY
jgi:diphthine methyl ester synthase